MKNIKSIVIVTGLLTFAAYSNALAFPVEVVPHVFVPPHVEVVPVEPHIVEPEPHVVEPEPIEPAPHEVPEESVNRPMIAPTYHYWTWMGNHRIDRIVPQATPTPRL